MAEKTSVTINIRGQEFRIVTGDGAESMQRVSGYLNDTMALVEQQTGTVDSLDLALLSALNLARELIDVREGRAPGAAPADTGLGVDPERLAALIELAEGALEPPPVEP